MLLVIFDFVVNHNTVAVNFDMFAVKTFNCKFDCLVFVCTVCQIKGEHSRLCQCLLVEQIVEIVAVLCFGSANAVFFCALLHRQREASCLPLSAKQQSDFWHGRKRIDFKSRSSFNIQFSFFNKNIVYFKLILLHIQPLNAFLTYRL